MASTDALFVDIQTYVDNPCSVCLEKLSTDNTALSCGHTYHKKCIDEWLLKSQTCPICRQIQSVEPVIVDESMCNIYPYLILALAIIAIIFAFVYMIKSSDE